MEDAKQIVNDSKEDVKKETKEDKPKEKETPSMISDANKAAERLETANKKQEELLVRQEEIMAKQRLSGKSEAGMQPPKPKKLSDVEYSEKLLKGEVDPLKEDGFI